MAPQPELLKWRLGSLNRLPYWIARILWPFQSWVLGFSSFTYQLLQFCWFGPLQLAMKASSSGGSWVMWHRLQSHTLKPLIATTLSLKNAKRNVRIATKPLYRDGMSSALHEEDTRGLAYSLQLFWQGSLTNQWPLYKKHSSTQHSCL